MNPKTFLIRQYLSENQYFKSIKDIDLFTEKLVETYPITDIVNELRQMSLWLDVNENRRKKRYDRFIVNWLGRNARGEYGK